MKLKEIPSAIYHSLRLQAISFHKRQLDAVNVVPVIVSLTSIPTRLQTLHLVIRSLFDQEVLPKKIVLWLNDDLEKSIPKKLKQLENELFEIRFSKLHCSHRKLVHSLEAFPNEIIVTCDDDLMYRSDWLKLLYAAHLLNKTGIQANQTRYIRYSDTGELLPYTAWQLKKGDEFNQKAVIPIGAGGVLYPPNSLDNTVINSELFLQLTPKADDLWFKAMALLKETNSYLARERPKSPIPIFGSQKQALKKTNIGEDKNRVQWLAVTNYFNLNVNT